MNSSSPQIDVSSDKTPEVQKARETAEEAVEEIDYVVELYGEIATKAMEKTALYSLEGMAYLKQYHEITEDYARPEKAEFRSYEYLVLWKLKKNYTVERNKFLALEASARQKMKNWAATGKFVKDRLKMPARDLMNVLDTVEANLRDSQLRTSRVIIQAVELGLIRDPRLVVRHA